MEYFNYLVFRAVLFIFKLLPFRAMYILADITRPILQYVVKYRRNIVRSQMRICFPNADEQWLAVTERNFYRNISDILFESIKGLAVAPEQIAKRVEYRNGELISAYLRSGNSVILTGSHHANWEWAAITVAGSIEGEVVGVYKRLTNKHIERYVKAQRAGLGMTLLEMKQTMQTLESRVSKPAVYVLMADQWPSNPKRAHWVQFMNRETACLPGVDFISRQYRFPVFFYEIRRVSRGYYRISYSELVSLDQIEKFAEGEITQLNQNRIAQLVHDDPANWLWSHKRWKRERSEIFS